MITCLGWVKQGVAKEVPDRVTLSKDDLKDIIAEAKAKLRETEETEHDVEDGVGNSRGKVSQSKSKSDASKSGLDEDDDIDDIDINDLYDLAHYDSEDELEGELMTGAGMSGVAYYASIEDDPYVTLKPDEAEDRDNFLIKPNDNLIVAGHVDQDFSILEISVYNEEEGSQYVHHDILLEAFPLAIEWLDFDPEDSSTPGGVFAFPSAPVLQDGRNRPLLQATEARAELEAARAAYLQHLAQDRLVQGGYVPDLVPILTWNEPGAGTCSSPTMTPPAMHSADMLDSPGSSVAVASKSFMRPGSMRSSVVNITAAALGAGALSLPRAMYYSGILWGPLLMLVLAALSILSIRMVVQLVELSGKSSYEEIAKAAFGPGFALLVEVNIVLFCFGTAVAYMITVGQISHQVLDAVFGDVLSGTLLQPNTVLMLTTLVILLPLSLLDSINDLRFASLAGVSCILYLICVVGYVFSRSHISPTLRGLEALEPKGGITGIFKMLSLSIFAFCCQPNVPSIYTELEQRSYKRMQKVSLRAMLLCCFVYLLMGVTGFLAFGENTNGNVLGNLQPMLCANDWIVRSGVAGMAFAVETALFYHKPQLDLPGMRTGIAVVAVACSLVVAIALPQINLVFELIGATTGSFVCFLGPGLLFHRLVPGHICARHKLKALLLMVVGLVFLVLGTYSSVLDVIAQLSERSDNKPLQCSDLILDPANDRRPN